MDTTYQGRMIRTLYIATNNYAAINSLCSELSAGGNELSKIDADNLSEVLSTNAGEGRIGKVRRQYARVCWEMFHGPYDPLPGWLNTPYAAED